MNKKVADIFDYEDYRILLNDDFLARSSQNPSYSLRAYARDLSISPGFLSDVFRGKKDLSPKKGREIFSKLGFDGEELEYLEHMILLRVTSDESQKRDSYGYVSQKYKKALDGSVERNLMFKSAEHLMIHGIVIAFTNINDILAVTEKLGIDRKKTLEVLGEFVEAGYVAEKDEEYFSASPPFFVQDQEQVLDVHNQYVNRCYQVMQALGGMSYPERVANMLVLNLNEETHRLVVEAHRQFIKTIGRISGQSKQNDRVVFWADTRLSLKGEVKHLV